jgi:hypothetical protein
MNYITYNIQIIFILAAYRYGFSFQFLHSKNLDKIFQKITNLVKHKL